MTILAVNLLKNLNLRIFLSRLPWIAAAEMFLKEKVNIKYLEELYFVYFGFLYIFYIKKEAFNSSFYLYFTIDF